MRRNDIAPRVLAMILAAATLFSTVSTVAFANEEEVTSQQSEIEVPEVVVQDETEESQPEEPQPEEPQSTEEPTQPETQPTESTQSEQEETPEIPATTVEETPETTAESTQEISEQTEASIEFETQAEEETTTDSLIDSLKSQGKKAADAIISTAKGKVSELFGNLIGAVPGGDYIKSLFDFLTGALGDEIIGNIWSETSELDAVIEKLEQIQADISKISSSVIELKNATFRNAINEVHRITGQYINNLLTYNKAVSELKKEPEGSERIAELEEKVNMAKATMVALASNQDISQTLRTNLAIAIQYMSSDTLGGESDNPFLLNLEAKKADPSFRYGTDLLAQQKQFDETVWRFFAEGLTLYTACMEINASVTENDVDAQLVAQNLASLLTGSSDGSESYIGNNVLNAIRIYNTKIRSAEDEIIGEYKRKIDDVVKFKFLTNANISKSGVLTNTDGSYNTEAEKYIMNFESNGYETYFKKLNQLIEEEYLSQYSSITLRRFITEKIGVTVPEQSKYLLLSGIRPDMYDVKFVKVIALDETNTSVQWMRLMDGEINNVCFFTDSINSIENRAASITLLPKNITFSFSTFEEAWNFANRSEWSSESKADWRRKRTGDSSYTVIPIILYQDVTAQKNGDENFTRFAYGNNFTSKQDGKTVYGALHVKGQITIDLNGHTINRNQDVPVAGGSVFTMDLKARLILKNGTVTGGNTTGDGGVVKTLEQDDVKLDNMVLIGNHADGYGGAICYTYDCDYEIKDTTITNNTAGKNGGGIYCKCKLGVIIPDVVVKGTVVIWDNTVNGKANNATLTDSGAKKSIFKLDRSFCKNSKIGVNSTTTDKWLDITNGCDLSKECQDSFHADNENQSLECYKGKVTKNWYICIWNNK